jgi:hypothetical protein
LFSYCYFLAGDFAAGIAFLGVGLGAGFLYFLLTFSPIALRVFLCAGVSFGLGFDLPGFTSAGLNLD